MLSAYVAMYASIIWDLLSVVGRQIVNAWSSIDLSGRNHKHKCPKCWETRWHNGTKAECPDEDLCFRCWDEQLAVEEELEYV